MFKLLTQEEKKKVMREYAARRGVVILSALAFVLVVTMIGLLPSYMLSDARYKEVSSRADSVDEAKKVEADEAAAWLSETNRALRLLSPSLDSDHPSEFVANVISERGTGISITGFSWRKNAEEKILLSVNGVAATRQDLIALESRIRESGHFAEVTLPISDLARDREIDFTISFSPAS